MAEYYISYKELENLLDQYIAEAADGTQLIEHKAEILSALTGDYEQENWDSAQSDKYTESVIIRVEIYTGTTNYAKFFESSLCIGFN